MNAHASVPLIGFEMSDGRVCIAWIMPSFAPNRPAAASACAAMNVSTRWRSSDVTNVYQLGRPGPGQHRGVEVSTEPSRASAGSRTG